MDVFLKRHWFKLVVLLLCVALGIYWLTTLTGGSKVKLENAGKAGEFALTNAMDGKEVTLQSTQGKVRLVYFYFSYCPDVCPPTTFMLSETQNLLKDKGYFGKDAQIISITIDPTRDTPERIQKWAGNYNADPAGWLFLRDDEEKKIHDLAKDGYKLQVMKDDKGNFGHMNMIVLLDRDGNIRKYFNANDPEVTTPEKMLDAMVSLMEE